MIPVAPPPGWVSSLDSEIKFYWKNKKSHIKLTTLQRPKQHGGLGAPNFYFYFLSQQLMYIYHWTRNLDSLWLDIEKMFLKQLDIQYLSFIDKSLKMHPGYKNNITISTAMNAWWNTHKELIIAWIDQIIHPYGTILCFLLIINLSTFHHGVREE